MTMRDEDKHERLWEGWFVVCSATHHQLKNREVLGALVVEYESDWLLAVWGDWRKDCKTRMGTQNKKNVSLNEWACASSLN